MRIAKPLLLVTTPIGVVWAIIEASRFHWWLAVLMVALVGVVSIFLGLTLRRIRSDASAERPPTRAADENNS